MALTWTPAPPKICIPNVPSIQNGENTALYHISAYKCSPYIHRITADGTCTGVQIEDTAMFDVSVSLTECNAENSGRTIP